MSVPDNYPVIVSVAAVENRSGDAEPVAMMVSASQQVLASVGHVLDSAVDTVSVVRGIWPYVDPGTLVAQRLPGTVAPTTAITPIGGNAAYDLVAHTAEAIANGEQRAAIICGAETMRTRRKDKAAGRRSQYLSETDSAEPGLVIGKDVPLSDEFDTAAGLHYPVNFYALVESRIRHRRRESNNAHLERIAALWAAGSEVASSNPHAWIREPVSAQMIATASETNRPIAAPYTKLLTSNIDVDQGAALLMSSYGRAKAAGIADADMVFVLAGASAHDELTIRKRERLDESPAMRAVGRAALSAAGLTMKKIDHLDLYSCFPAAVQLATQALGLPEERPFTITGGMTFAGGPLNGYGTQAIARAAELLRATSKTALLTGNGGYFTKHSALVLSGSAPRTGFAFAHPQGVVDREPTRPLASGELSDSGTIEAYTVPFGRDGEPRTAIVSVIDPRGRRHWALADAAVDIERLVHAEKSIGTPVSLGVSDKFDVPRVTF